MFAGVIGFAIVTWFIVAVLCVTLAVRALVLSKLWSWFVVPTFAAPELGFAVAAGLVAIAMLMNSNALAPLASLSAAQSSAEKKETPMRQALLQLVVDGLFLPMVILIAGWLAKGAL